MRYDDPIRPKLSDGRPMYLHDRPLAALPRLDIEPDGTGWDISIMLKVNSNSFSWFHARPQNEEELIGLLRDWKLDPEGVLLRWFGYSGPKGERELDIEDFL